jgi:hypothetical protein
LYMAILLEQVVEGVSGFSVELNLYFMF